LWVTPFSGRNQRAVPATGRLPQRRVGSPAQPDLRVDHIRPGVCLGRYAAPMAELPETWSVPVVRADFTDDAAWEEIKEKTT
jgi:hypothetical protein